MSNRIQHAKAYCQVFLQVPFDTGEESLLETLRNVNLSPVEAVSIIKESVRHNITDGKEIILREMRTEEFTNYIAEKLGQA